MEDINTQHLRPNEVAIDNTTGRIYYINSISGEVEHSNPLTEELVGLVTSVDPITEKDTIISAFGKVKTITDGVVRKDEVSVLARDVFINKHVTSADAGITLSPWIRYHLMVSSTDVAFSLKVPNSSKDGDIIELINYKRTWHLDKCSILFPDGVVGYIGALNLTSYPDGYVELNSKNNIELDNSISKLVFEYQSGVWQIAMIV